MSKHLVIQGCPPGGEWGVVDALLSRNRAADKDALLTYAYRKMHDWSCQANDNTNPLMNWTFRLFVIEADETGKGLWHHPAIVSEIAAARMASAKIDVERAYQAKVALNRTGYPGQSLGK